MKQRVKVRALSLLVVMLLTSAVMVPASAYYYCCAEWVNDYSSNPDFTNLEHNDENAQGFYYQLGGDSSWWGSFIYGGSQALERHWKDPSKPGSGIDYIYADSTHFAFFSSHGYDDG